MKLNAFHRLARARRGHTLLEVTLAALLLVTILGAVGMTTQRGSEACREGVTQTLVNAQAQRLVDRIASEFLDAIAGNVFVPAGGPPPQLAFIEYTRPTGFAGGAIVAGPIRRIEWVPSDSEIDDGVDNDSNGLIDDGNVVLTADTSAPEPVVLGSGVPKLVGAAAGLVINWNPNDATVAITVNVERVGANGQIVRGTAQTTVHLRNG